MCPKQFFYECRGEEVFIFWISPFFVHYRLKCIRKARTQDIIHIMWIFQKKYVGWRRKNTFHIFIKHIAYLSGWEWFSLLVLCSRRYIYWDVYLLKSLLYCIFCCLKWILITFVYGIHTAKTKIPEEVCTKSIKIKITFDTLHILRRMNDYIYIYEGRRTVKEIYFKVQILNE